jgi:predicted GIY-YIG superfamily endonuclease
MSAMEKKFHHHVYVVLLDAAVAKERKVRALNPQRDKSKPCVYVGMTGLPPIERFWNHKDGHKASYYVCKYGVKLLPELYEHLNPMPYEAACVMEMELAEELREQGYTVVGGK